MPWVNSVDIAGIGVWWVVEGFTKWHAESRKLDLWTTANRATCRAKSEKTINQSVNPILLVASWAPAHRTSTSTSTSHPTPSVRDFPDSCGPVNITITSCFVPPQRALDFPRLGRSRRQKSAPHSMGDSPRCCRFSKRVSRAWVIVYNFPEAFESAPRDLVCRRISKTVSPSMRFRNVIFCSMRIWIAVSFELKLITILLVSNKWNGRLIVTKHCTQLFLLRSNHGTCSVTLTLMLRLKIIFINLSNPA